MFFLSVFFFKQKTAYELRISDWSSDVCSSDLWAGPRRRHRRRRLRRAVPAPPPPPPGPARHPDRGRRRSRRHLALELLPRGPGGLPHPVVRVLRPRPLAGLVLGRALPRLAGAAPVLRPRRQRVGAA